MSLKDDIRNYEEQEDIEADYDRFCEEWIFDAKTQTGEHYTGLQMKKVFFNGGLKMRYNNLQEWGQKLEQEGLTLEEIDQYRRMLRNQFYILCEKNPQPIKELTLQEQFRIIQEVAKKHLN